MASRSSEIINERAGDMFLMLEEKTYGEVGFEFGLDKFYKNVDSMRAAVKRAAQMVVENPDKWNIDLQRVGYIQGKINSRSLNPNQELTLKEQEVAKDEDITSVVISTRDLAARLVRKKLQYLEAHPQALKDEKLVGLTTALAILFDKGQIIQGNATEHIAVLSNIPDNLNPEETLKAIMQMREKMLTK